MGKLKVRIELYKPPVSEIFEGIPGYDSAHAHDFDENEFWAVVIPEPKPGTPEANWIAPVPRDASFPIDTLGTEPLPAGTEEFNVSSVCIKSYKYNPYIYKILPPKHPEALGPIPDPPPPPDIVPPFYWCREIAPPTSGIGIWVVALLPDKATKLPKAPPSREAVFEPHDSIPGERKPARQPYMILGDDPRPKYVAYYDCTGWNSIAEIMNLQRWKAECTVTVYSRLGYPVWEQSLVLNAKETKRIYLDKYAPRDEGLIVIEPLRHGWEFPSTLLIGRAYRDLRPQFVPFTRIP